MWVISSTNFRCTTTSLTLFVLLIWSFFISILYFSCVQVNLSFRVGNTACIKPVRLGPNLKMVLTNALGWLNERISGYLYIYIYIFFFFFSAFVDFIIWKFYGGIAPWNMDPGLWCVSSALLFVYNYLMIVWFSSILLFPPH